MKKIQMLDLSGQYRKIKLEIDDAITKVIDSSAFINGEAVGRFASNLAVYTGAKHVIPCANCTDALQISLMALNLDRGDEVIVPAFTYMAPAEAAMLLGLKPVFVDVDKNTYHIDAAKIQAAITRKTKAVIPVHLFGQSADMEAILQIALENNLAVIEDCAQSIGTRYSFSDGNLRQCGTMGKIGCLSFFPSKNLGCFGDGGAMLTNDEELAGRLKMIASHGQSAKYIHEIVGCNSRLDTLQAAVLSVKLKYLDQFNEARRQAAHYYHENLKELDEYLLLPFEAVHSTHTYHQFTLQVKNGKRDALKRYLQEKEIPTMIYYPFALPEQPVFSKKRPHPEACANDVSANCENSVSLSASVLSLPMHTELDEDQLRYIVDHIKLFFNE